MKKIFGIIISLLLLFPVSLFAVSSSSVNYEVYDYIVDASVDVSGNLKVKEVIGIKGTFNGYIRDLVYKNNSAPKFTGTYDDFYGSSIYNGSGVEIEKVGRIEWSGELDFDVFNRDVSQFNECSKKTDCYLKSSLSNGISLKMFNETKNDITYFYLEYLVGNVVVVHEDIAEIYYNFIGDGFDDDIRKYQLRVNLPMQTKSQVLTWAHGPVNGEIYLMGKYNDDNYFISETEDGNLRLVNDEKILEVSKEADITYLGSYLSIEEIDANTPVDMRLVFSNELILIDHPYLKKSGIVALDNILNIENERVQEVNHIRKISKIKVYTVYIVTGFYLLGLLGFAVLIYIKYDKEIKFSFGNEYNREFIDDYDVTVIEYLFDRNITEKAFSTSILNMIYKKNISFEKINKKDYEFTRVSEDGLNESEKIIMQIIFDEAGENNKTTLSKIKKYAKEVSDNSSPFLSRFSIWKESVIKDSKKEEFYEENNGIKILGVIYSVIGFVIVFLHLLYDIFGVLSVAVFILSFIFLVYSLLFTKKTLKGITHYTKWKAFKRFLLDFGRFDEKDLPEIVLWERYLVYANIFGLAGKLSKIMKIKFNEMKLDSSSISGRDIFFDYMIWSHLNSSINGTVKVSVNVAHVSVNKAANSTFSSGSGFGGGFSSGGGFGGGGGGGRGF